MTRRAQARWGHYAMAGAGGLLLCALALVAARTPYEHVDPRHCIVGRPPPTVLAISLDTSDPLAKVEPRQLSYAVAQELGALNKSDRVVALDVGGKAQPEISPIVDQCHPGDGDNIERAAFRRAIEEPIARHLRDALSHPAAGESPLAETILALAADPSIHPKGSKLVVLFVTDGLQNSALQSAYRRSSKFPMPEGRPLTGVVIKLLLIKNDRDVRLQPLEVRRLTAWLNLAGAQVIAPEPGWLSLEKIAPHRGTR